jgi:hypothetical protein
MSNTVAPSDDRLTDYPYAPRPPQYSAPRSELTEALDVTRPERRFSLLAIFLSVVFLYGNAGIVPLMDDSTGMDWRVIGGLVLIGSAFAQIALACGTIVFLAAPYWSRLAFCWMAAIVLWGAWLTGLSAILLKHNDLEEALNIVRFMGLSMPLAAIAIQSPLWLFRLYLGWRIHDATVFSAPPQALSIRDYMLGTGMVALAITAARLARPEDWNLTDADYWPAWALFIGVVGAASLLSVPLASYLVLRVSRWWLGYGLLLLYGLGTAFVTMGVLAIFVPDFRQELRSTHGGWIALGVSTVFVSFAALLGAGLKVARDLGYELVLARRAR